MNNMTIIRAAEVCGAKLCAGAADFNKELGKVVIDSRLVAEGDLFVAYKGERVDGHDYIETAFQKGAAACLAERIPDGVDGVILLVDDVQLALEKIAAAYRESLNIPIIGITGSVGKTSAKEMISAVLSSRFDVLKTDKNLNNQIGVPMTISRIEPKHDCAVIEMGISGFGEMHDLSRMVKPTIAVFTVIGHAHLEFLHNLEGVLKAKTEMLDYMAEDALVIMNGDDALLRGFTCKQRKLLYGLSEGCDVKAENITSPDATITECDISYKNRRIHAVIPAYGQHMVYAALEGAAVGFEMGLSDEEIIRGIMSFETVGRRGAITETGFVTLIDDCYNSNPDSVKCGIDSLVKLNGRAVCILSDMLEQGENSPKMHYDIGKYAVDKGVELVITTGTLSKETALAAKNKAQHFESNSALIAALPRLLRKGDTILVKASRGMHLEEVSEAIKLLKDERPIVLLDVDDTILDFHKAERIALTKTLEHFDIEASEKTLDLYSHYNKLCWEALERGELSRDEVKTRRYELLFADLGINIPAKDVTAVYETNLCIGHYFIDGAEALLEALHSKYRLFIVSNGARRVQDSRLKSANILHYFEGVFISEQLGANKPSLEFFDACKAKIPNYNADKAIIIGDSLTSDILCGINAGIKTCWFNPDCNPTRDDIIPDYQIQRLSDLPELLERIFNE